MTQKTLQLLKAKDLQLKVKDIIKVLKNLPQNLPLIYASDNEEGDTYHPVIFLPAIGYYDGLDFFEEKEIKGKIPKKYEKVVCIN